jgi:hypothetical protein
MSESRVRLDDPLRMLGDILLIRRNWYGGKYDGGWKTADGG